jgi:hypothetical protein
LRISAHPETGSVMLSIWRGDHCVATHELPVSEIPELIRLLALTLVPPTEAQVAAS